MGNETCKSENQGKVKLGLTPLEEIKEKMRKNEKDKENSDMEGARALARTLKTLITTFFSKDEFSFIFNDIPENKSTPGAWKIFLDEVKEEYKEYVEIELKKEKKYMIFSFEFNEEKRRMFFEAKREKYELGKFEIP